MKKIIQYFRPKEKASYFEKLVINYFIYQVFFALLLLFFLISLNIITQNDNSIVSSISEAALGFFLVFSLFLLKKKGIKIAGNIFYIVMVGIILIALNILQDDVPAMFKYLHGFYTVVAFLVGGVLFASRIVILINSLLIFIVPSAIESFV